MNFINPSYLWGLTALAIPIIIHLFNFKKFKKTYFTNVSMIRQLSQETRRQSKLRHLIILIIRMLAIAALVLIFAQPYIPLDKLAEKTQRNKLVTIYLDNSFSMEMRDEANILLESAKSKIPDILGSYGSEDVFRFTTNDFLSEYQHLMSKEEVASYASAVQLSPNTMPLSVVLDRLAEVAADAKNMNRDTYILSDLQKSTTDFNLITNDSTQHIYIIPLKPQTSDNLYVDSCWFENPVHLPQTITNLKVRIINTSELEYEKIPVKVMINGKQKAVTSVDINSNSSITATFSYQENDMGEQKGMIQITDYPVTYDDEYFFTYSINTNIDVLCINGDEPNRYINALYSSDSSFHITNVKSGFVNPELLEAYSLIILNEVESVSTGLSEQIHKQCSNGASVVLLPSLGNSASYDSFTQQFNIPTPGTADTSTIRVSEVRVQSDFFNSVFDKKQLQDGSLPKQTDLPVINWHIQINTETGFAYESLMSLANGEPYLLRKAIGNGWVYLFSSPITPEAGNFAKHALFVPTFFRIAFLSTNPQPVSYIISKNQQIRIIRPQQSPEEVYHIENEAGDYSFIPGTDNRGGDIRLNLYDQIQAAGFYSIMYEDEIIRTLAMNYNRLESNLISFTSDEAREQIDTQNIAQTRIIEATSDNLGKTLESLHHGRQLWVYFVYLCLLLLLAEVILLRIWRK